MKFLVTGGAGFVGTNLIKRLLKDGHQVISFDNYSTGFKKNRQEGCQYLEVDISNSTHVNTYMNVNASDVDVIFHMAALPRIKPSFENPTEVIDVNLKVTVNILECARKYNIPVIYAGSSSFHGGVYKNPYTFSKWQGEELCKMYEQIYGLQVTTCRFYNVYGDHMINEGSYRTVLSIFLEQCKNNETYTITGDGEQRRDFTHVDDIIDAMVKCVENNKYGFTFELGRGKNYSIKEVVKMFPNSSWRYIQEIPGEVRETLCNSDLARKEIGWKPVVNLDEWIKEKA